MSPAPSRAVLLAACVAIATVAAHAGALGTPLFASEKAKLTGNPAITSLSGFAARMLTWKGLVQRPLGLLTFTATFQAFGTAPLPYFATNLALHVGCAVLVYLLGAFYVSRPVIPALIFGVHPLSTAVVVELFGRYYALATAFMLLALLWLHRRDRSAWFSARSLAVLGLLFGAMVASKQVLVFFVAIVAWLWLARDAAASGDDRPTITRPWLASIAAAAAIAGSIAVVAFYAIPFSRTAPVSPAVFFQSQLGNVDGLVALFVLPYRIAVMMLYPFHPTIDAKVVAGALVVVAAAVAAVRWRHRPWGFLLGAVLIALVPTNSVFPKDQLVLKWRLYPALVFVALLLGYGIDRALASVRSTAGRRALATAFAGYLAVMIAIDWRQNLIYRDELASFEQMAAMFPDAADGQMIAARECFRRGLYARALPHLRRAAEDGYRKPDLTAMLAFLERRGIRQ